MSYLNSEVQPAADFITSKRVHSLISANTNPLWSILTTSRSRQLGRLHCSPLRFQQQARFCLSQDLRKFLALRVVWEVLCSTSCWSLNPL